MNTSFFWLPPALLQAIVVAFGIAQLTITIILAVCVHGDAEKRQYGKRGLFLVNPMVWCVIVLLTGGYTGALAYWLIHYSTLKAKAE